MIFIETKNSHENKICMNSTSIWNVTYHTYVNDILLNSMKRANVIHYYCYSKFCYVKRTY